MEKVETVACEEFARIYKLTYRMLYECDKCGLVDYAKAVDYFDTYFASANMTAEFVSYRKDPLTSDRECAAFMMAAMGCLLI